jgi:hypothetical protein
MNGWAIESLAWAVSAGIAAALTSLVFGEQGGDVPGEPTIVGWAPFSGYNFAWGLAAFLFVIALQYSRFDA